MEVLYRSTRGNGSTVTASNAILKGLSEDGGLFVPDQIPVLDIPMEQLAQMSYQEVAYEVMSRFLTDFTEEEKCLPYRWPLCFHWRWDLLRGKCWAVCSGSLSIGSPFCLSC